MSENIKQFELNTEKFAGPMDLLLSLIEDKKMEITEVSLAQVTDEFLKHIGDIKQTAPGILADFLVIAARLLLIKSRALLPTLELNPEDQEDIETFTKRLEIYKIFKDASKNLKNLFCQNQLFGREFLLDQNPIFYPPEKLTVEDLHKAFQGIWEEFQKLEEATTVEKIQKIVKIEEKIQDILKLMTIGINSSFSKMVDKKEKIDIIISFLAILHMFKDRLVAIEQEKEFGEISLSLCQNNNNGN
jgi:segregation and condensation protein A